MRHRKKLNHLGRTSSHRKAMLANMASSLILHKRISTTVAKAKALRVYVEPLITKSKNDSTHSRRMVFSYLKNKLAVSELFREVSTKIAERPGGYTRILKTGSRLGDNADTCIIELVDYNESMLSAKAETKTPSRRRRGRGKKTVAAEGDAATASKHKSAEKVEVAESTPKKEVDKKTDQQEVVPAPDENDPSNEAVVSRPEKRVDLAKNKEDSPEGENKENSPEGENKEDSPEGENKEDSPEGENKEDSPEGENKEDQKKE